MSFYGDWAHDLFPGDGLELPSDDERNRADELFAEWAARWNEPVVSVGRQHDDGRPTNRAFLRSTLRRWFNKP